MYIFFLFAMVLIEYRTMIDNVDTFSSCISIDSSLVRFSHVPFSTVSIVALLISSFQFFFFFFISFLLFALTRTSNNIVLYIFRACS